MTTASSRWYREPLVWMLIAIPSASVAAGAVMLTLALNSDDGLVVDDYYRKGLEINRVLKRDHAAGRLGLNGSVQFILDNGAVHVQLAAVDGFRPPDQLRLGLYHATRSGLDRSVALSRTSDLGYGGPMPDLAPGRWYVHLEHERWRLTGVMEWPEEASGLTLTAVYPGT